MASKHYVNNAEMLASIKVYKEELRLSRENGTPEPRVPEYLGECVLKIAQGLSRKINFVNYSYKDDMILDGIENAIHVINSFDPNKSSNPFSYFTQVIYFAFLRRIAKEKKQAYIRGKLIQEMPFESFTLDGHDDDLEFKNVYTSWIQSNSTFDTSFLKEKEKTNKVLRHSLEMFMDDDNPITDVVEDIPEEIKKFSEDEIDE